ncbi:MAG: hypothetical protein EA420_03380, partial [Candidatus Competibacteraceae bacterium]
LWPADWQLWREDKFNTPGTVYDPTMWSHRTGNTDGAVFTADNITECPGGGLRLIGKSESDGEGGLNFTCAEIVSANWYGNNDNHGRGSSNITNQQYLPPYMITFRARYSEISTAVVQLPVRFGGWTHTHFAELRFLNATLGNPSYNDTQVGLEFDGDERQVAWTGHSHTNYLSVRTNSGSSSPGGGNIETGQLGVTSTTKDVWYDVAYLCYRNHEGRMFVRSNVNNNMQSTFLDTPISQWPDRLAIAEAIFDRNSHCMHFFAWLNMSDLPPGFDLEQQVTYDVRDFRVYVPPGDPRLSEPFKSNSPAASSEVPTFWGIVGSVTGNTLNLTITDAVPRATWSVSVVEDDPDPSAPVTLASTLATRVWTLGTRNVAVPAINISSLAPAKDLAVSVTHGGRTRTIVVERPVWDFEAAAVGSDIVVTMSDTIPGVLVTTTVEEL